MTAIQVKAPALTLRAGQRAIQHIRENGLQPADVHMIPGAAGGPKALGIQGLDLALFGEWLPRAPQPRSLIGASIGSWRFAFMCCSRDCHHYHCSWLRLECAMHSICKHWHCSLADMDGGHTIEPSCPCLHFAYRYFASR